MNLQRLGFTLFAAAAAVSVGACGGGDETITPTGPHYHYVMNRIFVPTTPILREQYALDLNGDGTVDNQLGIALTAIAGFNFDLQASIDKAVLGGKVITLVDLQTPDFSAAAGAGMEFFSGANPQPAACSGPSDTVICTDAKPSVCTGCGNHLDNGSFSVEPSSSQQGAIGGKITGGTFSGGPGNFTLAISLVGNAEPIRFNIFGAKIKSTEMSEAKIGPASGSTSPGGIILAGAVTKDDVDNIVIPGVVSQVNAAVAEGCTMLSAPPDCGCSMNTPAGKTGKAILTTLDKGMVDCKISVDEVKTLAAALLPQDVVIDGKSGTSVGVKATATKATFTVPGQ